MNLYKYESYKLLSKALVSFFRQLAESNEKSFIISGGSSPKQFLRYLAEEPLDWSKISIILSDERLVSHKDKKSNYRLEFSPMTPIEGRYKDYYCFENFL